MEGVEEVRQLSDTRLHWVASVAGRRKEWDARIVEQVPDSQVSWVAEGGAENAGTVSFVELAPERTMVTAAIEYAPEGVVESVGSALGFADGRIEDDLERFKDFIEHRGIETGAWRGQVPEGMGMGTAGSTARRAGGIATGLGEPGGPAGIDPTRDAGDYAERDRDRIAGRPGDVDPPAGSISAGGWGASGVGGTTSDIPVDSEEAGGWGGSGVRETGEFGPGDTHDVDRPTDRPDRNNPL
jgi:hypothetical protein